MQLDSVTDIGVKRKENQDNYWSALIRREGIEAGILCVCDGMGGLSNGQIASHIAVESIRDSIKEGIPFRDLESVIKQANQVIFDMGERESCRMGTTCTVVQCIEGRYEVLHVGDSRCYRIHNNSLYQITNDHSALKEYKITREENETLWKKYRNALTRCLGVAKEVKVDYYTGQYEEGDIFLVCSDGLWHYFDRYVWMPSVLEDLPELVKKCIGAGETDNITCSVLYS